MKLRPRNVLIVLAFLLVGEAVVRFDRSTMFFQGGPATLAASVPGRSPELVALEEGCYAPREDEWRVMVIGDSYLRGLGVPDTARFAVKLEDLLDEVAAGHGKRACVLDLTVAGYNTTMNAAMFHRHVGAFAPHAVVWAYDINDPYGVQPGSAAGGSGEQGGGAGAPASGRSDGRSRADRAVDGLKQVQRLVYRNSQLLHYVVHSVSRELKVRGVVIPGTVFHHELTRSHDPDFAYWRNSQVTLGGVWELCAAEDIRVLLLNCPVLKMRSHYSLYREVDERIRAYADGCGIGYLRGIDCFPDDLERRYSVSRYDSHPNEEAHRILARCVADALLAQGPPGPRNVSSPIR